MATVSLVESSNFAMQKSSLNKSQREHCAHAARDTMQPSRREGSEALQLLSNIYFMIASLIKFAHSCGIKNNKERQLDRRRESGFKTRIHS